MQERNSTEELHLESENSAGVAPVAQALGWQPAGTSLQSSIGAGKGSGVEGKV